MKNTFCIHFVNYCPRVYSGMDKWLVNLGEKMTCHWTPVFVYFDTLSFTPQLAEDFHNAGIRVEFIPGNGQISQAKAIFGLLCKYRPQIVHCHFVNRIKWLLAVLQQVFQYKYYVSFHSTIYDGGWPQYEKDNNWIKAALYKYVYCAIIGKKSSKILCVSKAIQQQWMSFFNESKSELMYLGVDTHVRMSKTEARELLHIPQNEVAIVNVSAIEYIKGIDVLLKALAILKQNGLSCHFYHIGGLRNDKKEEQAYFASLKNLVDDLQINELVTWLGKRTDVALILSAFDIYVHPSRQEGIGMTNMEAAVAGLPLIGANIGGIPEVVSNGENGFLFSNENINDLASCLTALISHPEERIKMGKASRRIVKELFDIDYQTDKLIKLYQQC